MYDSRLLRVTRLIYIGPGGLEIIEAIGVVAFVFAEHAEQLTFRPGFLEQKQTRKGFQTCRPRCVLRLRSLNAVTCNKPEKRDLLYRLKQKLILEAVNNMLSW